jgi:hypothetical protein
VWEVPHNFSGEAGTVLCIWNGTAIMMKILSLVMAAAWLVGQVSTVSSSDDPSYLSQTDNNNNNEDNNIITGGPVELRRVIIMHRSGTTTTTKKSGETGAWPVFPTTSTTTSMVVDGNDDDTDHYHQQQHDWVSQPPPPPAQKARQLQTRHEQACKLMYDDLIVENPGASCECKRGAGTFTCVNPPKCVEEVFTTCVGGGEICGFVTNTYGYYFEGNTVVVNTQRSITQYTSGGGNLGHRKAVVDASSGAPT